MFYCQSFCNTTLFLVYLWITSKFIASTFTLYYSFHIKYKILCAAKALRDSNGIRALNMYMCKIPKCLVIYCIRRAIFLDLKHFILEETYADYISPAFILYGMSLLTLANNFQFFWEQNHPFLFPFSLHSFTYFIIIFSFFFID